MHRVDPGSPNTIVVKHFNPSGLYADELPYLAQYAAQREVLYEAPGLVLEISRTWATPTEQIRARPHVRDVFREGFADVIPPPDPEVVAYASTISMARARALAGLDELVAKGGTGKGVRVAVLDTGCAQGLADRYSTRLVAKESYVDGEDWKDTDSGHGSFCLQVIGDAMPEAELVSIKVLSSKNGSGYSSWIIKGMRRAKELGCHVVSMSLGGPGSPTDAMSLVVDDLQNNGISVVCAAGNEQRGATQYMADKSHPGCAAGAICVGAHDDEYLLAAFSNWGNALDCTSIGVKINGALMYPDYAWSGTSMSCPHVAALVVGLRSLKNSEPEIRKALYAGCSDTAYEVFKEGYGYARGHHSANILEPPAPPAPQPEPEPEPEGFYPHLPRVYYMRAKKVREMEECVTTTASGKLIAYSRGAEPKS